MSSHNNTKQIIIDNKVLVNFNQVIDFMKQCTSTEQVQQMKCAVTERMSLLFIDELATLKRQCEQHTSDWGQLTDRLRVLETEVMGPLAAPDAAGQPPTGDRPSDDVQLPAQHQQQPRAKRSRADAAVAAAVVDDHDALIDLLRRKMTDRLEVRREQHVLQSMPSTSTITATEPTPSHVTESIRSYQTMQDMKVHSAQAASLSRNMLQPQRPSAMYSIRQISPRQQRQQLNSHTLFRNCLIPHRPMTGQPGCRTPNKEKAAALPRQKCSVVMMGTPQPTPPHVEHAGDDTMTGELDLIVELDKIPTIALASPTTAYGADGQVMKDIVELELDRMMMGTPPPSAFSTSSFERSETKSDDARNADVFPVALVHKDGNTAEATSMPTPPAERLCIDDTAPHNLWRSWT